MTTMIDTAPPAHAATSDLAQAQQRVSGRLRLDVMLDQVRARSVVHVREQHPPLQLVRSFALPNGAVLAHMHNIGGGVLGGDRLDLALNVGPHAQAQITTTGATRIYRHRAGAPPAVQTHTITVGEGALLEYVPDALIPFAGARYKQTTHIEMAANAGVFWWETVSPGRTARGEVFRYDLLDLSLDMVANGRPFVVERVRLEPAHHQLAALARLGPYRYWTTFYVCKVGVDVARWLALERQLSTLAHDLTQPDVIVWGVSTLAAHGLTIRALSGSERHVLPGLHAFWRAAKHELYEHDAVPPRKVY